MQNTSTNMHAISFAFGLLLISACQTDRIIVGNIKRIGSRDYNFFPLCRDFLLFTVRASYEVHIVLSSTYDLNSAYYEILIDGEVVNEVEQVSKLRKDGITMVVHNGTVLNQKGYQQFWVSINGTDESISVGKQRYNALMRFKDPNFVKMSYFGLGTPHIGFAEYSFDASTVICL